MIKLSSPATEEFWEVPVLYEDEALLALNKPATLPLATEPANPGRPTLIELLHQGIRQAKPWAVRHGLSFLMYAHRLDAEASGTLLLAKSKPVLVKLLNFFGSEQPSLSILTVVQGKPSEDTFSVEAKLARHPNRPGVYHVNPKSGKRARTLFEVVERFEDWCLVRCAPLTFRPHQVRVHLARAGFRVAGDSTYGGVPLLLSRLKRGYHLKPGHTERPLLGQACLHAERLTLSHPVTGAPLAIEAPLPKDLLVALKYLRKHGGASSTSEAGSGGG